MFSASFLLDEETIIDGFRAFDLDQDDESALEFKSDAFRRFKSLPKPFAEPDNSPIKSETSISSPSSSLSFGSILSRELTPERRSGRSLFSPSSDHSPDHHQGVLRLHSPVAKTTLSLHEDEEGSQDSGVGLDKAQSPFAKPVAPAPRRCRILGDKTNHSPSQLSPKHRRSSTPDFRHHFSKALIDSESPVKLRKSSLTFSPEADDGDDGFLDLVEGDEHHMPRGMEGLLRKPLLTTAASDLHKPVFPLAESDFTPTLKTDNQENIRPKKIGSRRGLFRCPSTPNITTRHQVSPQVPRNKTKRCDEDELTPTLKRRKSVADYATPDKIPMSTKLQRSHSTSDAIIRSLDSLDSEDVIGDFSKPYCLPSIPGKHSDLKCISPETLARLVRGEYDHLVEKYMIIDSRFPYEFEGGHIQDAVNIWERDSMMKFLQSNEHRKPTTAPSKRKVIIFHCEFSSERGPKMSRFLRKQDRSNNKECYPSLDYPELYLLEGGYKAFYHKYVDLCEPQLYKPMSHEDHLHDLRHFRAKSKSWAGEKAPKGSRIGFRALKL